MLVTEIPKVALLLAGGASLALAHIGVFRAMEERGIKPSIVAGVSAGAVVGALIASGLPSKEIREISARVSWFRITTPAIMEPGLAKLDKLAEFIEKNCGAQKIEDLKIPMRVLTADLTTGLPVVHDKGRLGQIVSASCSVPGLFAPVKIGGVPHIDGGIVGNLPFAAIAEETKLDFVLAVDPLRHCVLSKNPSNIYRVLMQSFLVYLKSATNLQESELKIKPKCIHRVEPRVGLVDPFDLNVLDLLEPVGYKEAIRVLDNAGF